MKLRFFGAVRTTTGSMHLLDVAGTRIPLDCGLYQGRRKVAFERNRNLPPEVLSADVAVLSHAHIDHSGNLPSLVKKGFEGRIIATPATCDLCEIMLADSAWLQVQDVRYVNKKRVRKGKRPFEPLYKPEDVPAVIEKFRRLPYERSMQIAPGVVLTFFDAGHILGSAFTQLDITENGTTRRMMFTGDIGRSNMPILRDPQVLRDVDVLVTESTYGNRLHSSTQDVKAKLAELCTYVCKRKSRLIIPSFSVGRTQQVLYYLNELSNEGLTECVPVRVDSPLSARATDVHQRHPECYDAVTAALLQNGDDPFWFPNLQIITDVEDSKKLNAAPGPVCILSASGMCEGGRIQHHLKHAVKDETNVLLFVGYQAQHTLGRRIVEGVTPIRIFGDEHHVRCQVHTVNALSAHADRNEMLDYYREMDSRVGHAFVVHGAEEASLAFADALTDMGMHNVVVPESGKTYDV